VRDTRPAPVARRGWIGDGHPRRWSPGRAIWQGAGSPLRRMRWPDGPKGRAVRSRRGRGRRARRAVIPVTGQIPAASPATALIGPWRHVALTAATALAGTPRPVGELVRVAVRRRRAARRARRRHRRGGRDRRRLDRGVDVEGRRQARAPGRRALDRAAPLARVDAGAVDRVDRVDVFGDARPCTNVDYTGTYDRGTPRQVTLVKDLRMGPFVYLARLAEGIVVPLEPNLRQRPDPSTGVPALYWADAPITQPACTLRQRAHRPGDRRRGSREADPQGPALVSDT